MADFPARQLHVWLPDGIWRLDAMRWGKTCFVVNYWVLPAWPIAIRSLYTYMCVCVAYWCVLRFVVMFPTFSLVLSSGVACAIFSVFFLGWSQTYVYMYDHVCIITLEDFSQAGLVMFGLLATRNRRHEEIHHCVFFDLCFYRTGNPHSFDCLMPTDRHIDTPQWVKVTYV
jgi:hypothetical protein